MAVAVRVRLLSGEVVWEGERPATLAALRAAVARAWGAPPAELVFFPVQAPGGLLDEAAWDEAAPGELMAVRDAVMGLLPAFLAFLDEFWIPTSLPEKLKPAVSHRHCMLAAVQQHGGALKHASAELRADRAVVLAAMKDGWALHYLSDELRANRAVVLAAVQNYGLALEHASAELRADRAVVLAAVQQHGKALEHASAELRADRAVVLAAVQQHGGALQHASVELRADREVVLAAVQQHFGALRFASQGVDRAVVVAAVQRNLGAWYKQVV
jgi:hypothetical protein